MKTLIILIAILIATTTYAKTNEIIPIWNSSVGGGEIQDMEIMPGGNEFILTTHEATIEVRSTEDGSLVREYVDPSNLFVAGDIEFTPDSNRIILGIGGLLQILDLETFERQRYFAFGQDTIARGFSNLVVDPIRPIVYATINGVEKTSRNNNPIGKIQAYNYETMEPVRNFTEYGNNRYEALAISSDGKYLATINDGFEAYLKIWDLETNELIVNKSMFDKNSNEECFTRGLTFSEKERSIIYISGGYTDFKNNDGERSSVIAYDFEEDIRTSVAPDGIYTSGNIFLFDNDSRVILNATKTIGVINVKDDILEWYNKPPDLVYSSTIRYNKHNDSFLSVLGSKISNFIYDRETNIEQGYQEEIVISPNPTHSIVNISIECIEPNISYDIYNTDGVMINQNMLENQQNNFIIDFSSNPTGVYFLTFICNNEQLMYKIIKEG